ncbi:MAG: argininosuccinate synthase [Bacteroidetes bacterium]|nr:argininosuccinate synthase [Bacteroidota bacterium]
MAIVLAFSGGLDTSFCVLYLREHYGDPVYTVTVNTGGIDEAEAERLAGWAKALGSAGHWTVDGRRELFVAHLSYLIKGNVLRGGVYPLCVGPERVVQARKVVEMARQLGAWAVAHGSTGAGNDQIRFDVALRVLADDLAILTPIRDLGWTREQTAAYLRARGFPISEAKASYSINRGLWGTTIGGRETLTPSEPLPPEAWVETQDPALASQEGVELRIDFEKGLPTALDGEPMDPVALIEALNRIGAAHGVGRGTHVGDTILGIKGRIGFEAPAALVLITAHRELEKLVLTKWQRFQKDHLADFYGMLLHEGQYFDPVMRDIEAFLDSSQQFVTGTVRLRLRQGRIEVLGAESPYALFAPDLATYGEVNKLWSGRDAEGFARIWGVPALLAHRVRSAFATQPQKE